MDRTCSCVCALLSICCFLQLTLAQENISPCPHQCTCVAVDYLPPRTSKEKSAPKAYFDSSTIHAVEINCNFYGPVIFNLSDGVNMFWAIHPNISDRSLDVKINCYNKQTIVWQDAEFLRNTTYFTISGCTVETGEVPLVFPNSSLVYGFHMSNITSNGFWRNVIFSGFDKLRHMTLPENNFTTLPGNLASVPMPVLHHFQIPNNQLTTVDCRLLQNTPQLLQFWGNFNHIKRIPECVCLDYFTYGMYDRELWEMLLENNAIDDIFALSCDLVPAYVYLSHNKIAELPNFGMRLSIIHLDHNQITSIPTGRFQDHSQLSLINLNDNFITTIESQAFNVKMNLLTKISISGNALTHFETAHAPSAELMTVEVDLRRNRLLYPPMYDSVDSDPGTRHIKFYATDNAFSCDCDMSRYMNVLNDQENSAESSDNNLLELLNRLLGNVDKDSSKPSYIDMSQWKCSKPDMYANTNIVGIKWSNDSCPVVHGCPDGCSCTLQNDVKLIKIQCSGLTSLPETVPVLDGHQISLNVSNNKLTDLSGYAYFRYLVELDASTNNISSISDSAILQMDGIKTLYLHDNNLASMPRSFLNSAVANSSLISLAGNPWDCRCVDEWFVTWVTSHEGAVVDARDIFCHSPQAFFGRRFDEEIFEQLNCNTSDDYIVIASSVGVATAIILVAVVLVVVYREDIKVLLYVKWNLDFGGGAKEGDFRDRDYDAFVSYSSHDGTWVRQELLPLLEGDHIPSFKTCFHERNFLPGVPIAENIINSIRNSKRSILVVSKNFIDSEWCQFEFLTAHKTFMETKRNKLIVLLVGESVDVKSLDPIIRAYFTTKTFIRVTDRLFKEKLLYAMPHKEKPTAHDCELAVI